jgi:protein involved in polysaccharide export with SLBB domain
LKAHRWPRTFLDSGFALFAVVCFMSCQATVSTRLPEERPAQTAVILSPGDVVKITFPGATELSQSQRIQADGKINLPLVGEVDAAGRTVADLQRRLETLYKPQLQNTAVLVTLESSVTPVTIGGAVNKPGKYSFDRPTTVLQAIMEAGGTSQFGTLGKITVIRLVNGQERMQVLDLRPILRGQPMQPVYVHAGDVLMVGESAF